MIYKYEYGIDKRGNKSIKRASFTESEMIDSIVKRCVKVGDCMEWPGHRVPKGYGVVGFRKKVYRAHRLLWILMRGPIAPKLEVCHSCDNRACCNIDHLFIGTHQDNMTDMVNKGRFKSKKGEDNALSKLKNKQVLHIRKAWKNRSMSKPELAVKYGISRGNIDMIVYRKTWTHI